jgi:predicted ArsR family transcriptional regulator
MGPNPDGSKTGPDTRRAIARILKQDGAQVAGDLAAQLSVTAMAVRQHLYAMRDERLVTYTEQPRPLGRPAKLWRLTPEADRLFPDGYAELTLDLIGSLSEAFGSAGIERLLAARTRRQIESYQSRISPRASLARKVLQLAHARTVEGYMAEVCPRNDGSWLLVENHCPICAAARACQGLCGGELEVFRSVLGERVSVERIEHILAGARRCAYVIQPRPRKRG